VGKRVCSSGSINVLWNRCPKTALRLNKADDAVQPLALFQICHDKGPLTPHALRIGVHLLQRCADMGREVDLVNHEEIGSRNAGAAFGRNLKSHLTDAISSWKASVWD